MISQGTREHRIAKFVRFVLLAIGCLIVGAALSIDWFAGRRFGFGFHQQIIAAVGIGYFLLGVLITRLPAVFLRIALCLASVAILVTGVEATSHLVRYDFDRMEAAWHAYPVYCRMPNVPTGPVYFRRSGPDTWTGKVLSAEMKCYGYNQGYPDEEVVTINYDQDGFRNPPDLDDWDIVVVGDSFTELGYLKREDISSSRIAEKTKLRVKNLGVSHTGTLTQNWYLREFGLGKSTTDAVLVFYEGNDLGNAEFEFGALQKWKETGVRGYLDFESKRQSSFVRACWNKWSRKNKIQIPAFSNASFTNTDPAVPLVVRSYPPNESDATEFVRTAVETGISEYGQLAALHNLRPWLVYMPAKIRVLHGHLEFHENAQQDIRQWQPSDLPQWIESLCQENGIRLIDLTPALREQTEQGILTYNHVFDEHLNRQGSILVGDLVGDELRRELATPTRQSL